MTVGLSIFILAITLLHSAQNTALRADQFHRCALEVNALRRELLAIDDDNLNVASFASRYDEILGRYNINHEDVDYDRYRLEHPSEFSDVAAEDVSTARKNVQMRAQALEGFAMTITLLTGIIALVAGFGGTGLFEELLVWLQNLRNE